MENEVAQAIRTGDLATLNRLLSQNSDLVNARIDGQRTLLHIATDWPGHFPNIRQTIQALAHHGADLNATFHGTHSETALHWAASSDDLDALDALLDLGANIEAPGSVIGGGTPLSDAVAFGCWPAARRLIERGACPTIWQSAALGLTDRVKQYFAGEPGTGPSPQDVTNAFWCACHGGQLESARYLLAQDADPNWIGHDRLTPLDAALRHGNEEVIAWLRGEGARGANH